MPLKKGTKQLFRFDCDFEIQMNHRILQSVNLQEKNFWSCEVCRSSENKAKSRKNPLILLELNPWIQ